MVYCWLILAALLLIVLEIWPEFHITGVSSHQPLGLFNWCTFTNQDIHVHQDASINLFGVTYWSQNVITFLKSSCQAGGFKYQNFLTLRVDWNINYIFGILTSRAINWYINESILRGRLVGGHLGGLGNLGGVSRIFLGHFQQIIFL
jgi:hypothetical protein